jgi:hypothetical protein
MAGRREGRRRCLAPVKQDAEALRTRIALPTKKCLQAICYVFGKTVFGSPVFTV